MKSKVKTVGRTDNSSIKTTLRTPSKPFRLKTGLFGLIMSPLISLASQEPLQAQEPPEHHHKIINGYEIQLGQRDMTITPVNKAGEPVGKGTNLVVPPCPILDIKDAADYMTADDSFQVWLQAIRKSSAIADVKTFMRDIVIQNSIKLVGSQAGPAEAPKEATPLIEDRFLPTPAALHSLDQKFMTMLGVSNTILKTDPRARITYKVRTRRLDTVVKDAGGNLKLLTGTADTFAPDPPTLGEKETPLLNVFAPREDESLANYMLVGIGEPKRPVSLGADNESLKPVLDKLKNKQGLKIVFWGDSISAGGFASSPQYFFTNRFQDGLSKLFPDNKLTVVNQAVSGSNTGWRLAKFDKEVIAEGPDLLIVEFLNDYTLRPEVLAENYKTIIAKAKAANIPLIICVPHPPVPSYVNASTWHAVIEGPYPKLLRKLCQEHGVAICDVAKRWDTIGKEGLKPKLLLVDGLLHPNNHGHKIYAEELLALFQSAPRKASAGK